jgi:hypothetical protein
MDYSTQCLIKPPNCVVVTALEFGALQEKAENRG